MQGIKPSLVTTLRRLPLFSDLSEPELALVAEHVVRREYQNGMIIFSDENACRELLIVEEGSVKLLKTSPNGRQQLIGIERPGNSLAEVPVFDGGRYTATAEAIGKTILLRLEAEHFRRICLLHPEVGLKVIKVLAHRMRHLDGLVEELSFSTVRGRLVAHLSRLAEETGRPTTRGVAFDLCENNEELAARLGTVRELVSRNLGRLHGEGLIEIRRRTVIVPSLSKLRSEIARTS
jgi:CRP/FNR family transcriptional regulator, cyclic AMP receptor protein